MRFDDDKGGQGLTSAYAYANFSKFQIGYTSGSREEATFEYYYMYTSQATQLNDGTPLMDIYNNSGSDKFYIESWRDYHRHIGELNNLMIRVKGDGRSSTRGLTDMTKYGRNKWIHLVITMKYSSSEQFVRFYLNGVLDYNVGSGEPWRRTTYKWRNRAYMGCHAASYVRYFRIWNNVALTDDQVAGLYERRNTVDAFDWYAYAGSVNNDQTAYENGISLPFAGSTRGEYSYGVDNYNNGSTNQGIYKDWRGGGVNYVFENMQAIAIPHLGDSSNGNKGYIILKEIPNRYGSPARYIFDIELAYTSSMNAGFDLYIYQNDVTPSSHPDLEWCTLTNLTNYYKANNESMLIYPASGVQGNWQKMVWRNFVTTNGSDTNYITIQGSSDTFHVLLKLENDPTRSGSPIGVGAIGSGFLRFS